MSCLLLEAGIDILIVQYCHKSFIHFDQSHEGKIVAAGSSHTICHPE